MARFRRRDFDGEAVQWRAAGDCPHWAGHLVQENGEGFEILTSAGTVCGEPGDWIVWQRDGRIEIVPGDRFAELYEVENGAAEAPSEHPDKSGGLATLAAQTARREHRGRDENLV